MGTVNTSAAELHMQNQPIKEPLLGANQEAFYSSQSSQS